MAFDNIEFPLTVAKLGASPEFSTAIVETGNGSEQRTALWDDARLRFDASTGVRTTADLTTLIKFFRARKGMARGFYVKDWTDYQATNQPLLTTVGGAPANPYQLNKSYTDAGNTDVRPLRKIKTGTLVIFAGATQLTETTHYTVDYATGLVTFVPASWSYGAGVLYTFSCEFYTPVRFATDRLNVDLMHYRVTEGFGEVPEVPLVEIRDFQ